MGTPGGRQCVDKTYIVIISDIPSFGLVYSHKGPA